MLEIVEYQLTQRKSPRRGHRALEVGEKVFLVRHIESGKVFNHCYVRRMDAEMVQTNLMHSGLTKIVLDFNFIDNPEKCRHIENTGISL